MIRKVDPYLCQEDIKDKVRRLRDLGVTDPEHLGNVSKTDLREIFSSEETRQLLRLAGKLVYSLDWHTHSVYWLLK